MFKSNYIKDISFLLKLNECTTIPENCFSSCYITLIPDEVFEKYYIDEYAFSDNEFEELKLPEYAKLKCQVFSNNTKLKTVVSNSPIISFGLFEYCNNLEKVIIKNATEIKASAFRFCNIKDLFFEDDNLQVIDDYAFANNSLEDLALDKTNLSVIKSCAFEDNNLKLVKLPFFLTELYASAFLKNERLVLKRAEFPFAQIVQE